VGDGLIAAELLLGVLLLSGLAPVFTAAGAIALFTAFAVALGVSLARSNTAPCHCFSNGREPAHQVLPEFAVDQVTLDQHKMITAGITFS
jgi:Methylamine utilisation protein MauE